MSVPHMSIRIGEHEVGPQHRPFIIAEMSGNHNGDLDRALAIVDMVADSGAQALKLQTYTPDTITLDSDRDEFFVDRQHELWGSKNLYALYQEAHTPWEWHKPIFDRARERGLAAFSSPFDPTAVEFLEELGVPAYKVASAEIVDLPLIRLMAKTGKPLILSTGMATVHEIAAAVEAARDAGLRAAGGAGLHGCLPSRLPGMQPAQTSCIGQCVRLCRRLFRPHIEHWGIGGGSCPGRKPH